MQIVITAKTGFARGASWLLDNKPLLIGRSYRCDIVVDDSTVSRQHCRIERVRDGVHLQDLGSRNPALVKGSPERDVVLAAGDEFSIGKAVFLVTAVATATAVAEKRPGDSDTISLDLSGYGLESMEQSGEWPGTLTDYVLLFQFSRACSQLNTEAALCQKLREVFETRYPTDEVAVLEEESGEWPLGRLLGRAREGVISRAAFERLVSERQAISSTIPLDDGACLCVLMAPVCFGPSCQGVGVLVSSAEEVGAQREQALRLFSAMCELLGPYLHAARQHEELVRLNHRLSGAEEFEQMPLVGQSRLMKALRTRVYEAAQTPLNVLITGDTGTGKEVIARAIHRNSVRNANPYIVINCAAIPPELFESELFGYERGAFTGAHGSKKGLLALADGGTLFLDEVADLSAENQARILRVLEQGTYRRVGAGGEEYVDVRFVAATNRPVEDKGFRSDLYHRLAGFTLHAPPLRDRAEDIPLLAQHFLDGLAAREPALLRTLSPDAEQALRQFGWPGNVRQLRNLIERIAHRTPGSIITAEDIWRDGLIRPGEETNKETGSLLPLAELEREHIYRVLRSFGNNRAKAARVLGISRSTLYAKLAEYGEEA